ncbi:MAG: leucine--tRNA ligase [Candidatus Phytoplasma stylosanthis]|uniref:leucine--tRNA ligase n=1 Tax=Candidatus Phytoplasma stylosanthis TaxID=2798314 RepID=UPI00293B15A5|nr:leucine--tRNA ligase [Candidatus Phytoplasma stylosanthis]MDV3167833.1 leucine--tRNA ligase [Candidatus Phytoplasma stylosanthis]MDV3173703.1 leucine--tRNA ligase [Candidatus Phytoplasma stylosanthis]MDV3174071.1 leucine--tRNA ligase [Candidatus Phytoplasma stylosanthis]
MLVYDFKKIEFKWQVHWENKKTFKTNIDFNKKKFYCLDMFPYPSSSGLHIGHIKSYTASDIVNRFKRMNGYNVFHPFGWDSFGLPAEQYALNTGNNPISFTYKNIDNFRKQIKMLGKGIDWDTELATSEPYFYHWTQWIFKKFYEKNIAFLQDVNVNFCEQLGTVLSNEEVYTVENKGTFSEKGDFPVVKKKMKQWVLKISSYFDRLLEDLNLLDWPSQLKDIQKNWIGKKKGFIFNFRVSDEPNYIIKVFTTRPHTIFGVNSIVLSPEHPLVFSITKKRFVSSVNSYIKKIQNQTDLTRNINKNKTGVFTGNYIIHPFTKKEIPIWISDYVLPYYGTGAIMSVPFCDERDFLFSKKYNLEIIPIFEFHDNCANHSVIYNKMDNFLINSFFLNKMNIEEADSKIIELAQKNKLGYIHSTYQMHDWIFSRQRYWGEPFPIYYDENDNIYLEEDEKLPLLLPILEKIEISGDGFSPLSKIKSWLYFTKDEKKFKRDSNTMPQTAGSSWYYIAYILKNKSGIIPLNSKEAKEKLDYFLPVDLYIGGKEHAVGHLLYSRFWHKFLYDLGLVSCSEPFTKIVNQGMILGEDHLKMSKSKENSVNASLILEKYGSDVTRIYIMFLGPLEEDKVWNENGLRGVQRFLNKVYNCFSLFLVKEESHLLVQTLNKTIKIVTEYYEKLKFNTVISQLMIFINQVCKIKKINHEQALIFLKLLNPLAPHLTEELNQKFLNNSEELVYSRWPAYENKLFIDQDNINILEIIIQINGNYKSKIKVFAKDDKEIILKKALKETKISYLVKNRKILNVIYIKNKILNLVI